MTLPFISRRSSVFATRGMVASSQPLASQTGLQILMQGGNAADAAIATAAALNVTEPCSTGIGGDAFVLYYESATQQVHALNGSGRAPMALDVSRIRADGLDGGDEISDPRHAHCVTVPGAAAAWCDLNARFGGMPLADLLAPAIRLAEEGFPVAPLTAHAWQTAVAGGVLARGCEMTINGRAPRTGELFRNPGLGRTFRALSEGGAEAFYRGHIGRALVQAVQRFGGVMTEQDLAAHHSAWVDPISTVHNGVRVYECPPNGQGITALIALNILRGLDLPAFGPRRMHLQIEALRLAFADTRWFVADPVTDPGPLDALLSESYAASRRALLDPDRARADVRRGSPDGHSDTVYFCVVDGAGNAASFINSNYMGFGSGIIPDGWGFTLQNRGHNFSTRDGHPNQIKPGKRPYHTIMPGMMTRADGGLLAPFGVMGGYMQPQGHVQVAQALLHDALEDDPQTALDLPRFFIESGTANGMIGLEAGIPVADVDALRRMGHTVRVIDGHERGLFGRGQLIVRRRDGVLAAGSDPRADGCAMGY